MTAAPAAPKSFAAWWSQMERWSVSSFMELDWQWPPEVIRPLADALERRDVVVDRKAHPHPPLLTLHFTGEMHHRDRSGTKPVKGRLWWAKPGEVVYSKIDVRNGAIGVVPDELGSVAVTSEYPVYHVRSDVADASYIKLLFRTNYFRRRINSLISGASGRKRVQPGDLEALSVPLPPLREQRAIVAAFEKAKAKAASLRAKADELDAAAEADFLKSLGLTSPEDVTPPKAFALAWSQLQPRWGVDVNQRGLATPDPSIGKYPVARLSELIADLGNGISPKCHDRPAANGEWGVLKLGAVSFGAFNPKENKALPKSMKVPKDLEIKPGDWLISRANITRLVGACALVRETPAQLLLCDKIFRADWHDPSPVEPEFLDAVMKIPHTRFQIESNVTGTSATMKNITKPALLSLRLPHPPRPVQRGLVRAYRQAKSAAAAHRAQAAVAEQAAREVVEALIMGTRPTHAPSRAASA